MTYNEARESTEFFYTGMAWRKWDKDKGEEEKARARELKKKYKGVDYRVVDEGNGYKVIYGNKLFNKVIYFNEERTKKWIDSYSERVARLNEEYKEKLHKLDEDLAKTMKEYNEILSLKRV